MNDNLPAPTVGPDLSTTSKSKLLAVAFVPPETSGFNSGVASPNACALLLTRAKMDSTRCAYANNLRWFFRDVYQCPPDPAAVRAFLSLSELEMKQMLAEYCQRMKDAGSSPATMSLRLTSIRALVDMGKDLHLCAFDSKKLVFSTTAKACRDTRGLGLDNVLRMLALPDRATLKGIRDLALLRLLYDNALRRCEIGRLDITDFEPEAKRIAMLGQGQDEKEWITLYPSTVAAVQAYLKAAGHKDGALFRSCAFRQSAKGLPLTDHGLYLAVREYGKQIGLKVSSRKSHYFVIMADLDKTDGDMRRVKKFSRHKRYDILQRYDDNRADLQGGGTTILEGFTG